MVDIGAIAAVASSLKAAGDITKAAIGLRDAQALQSKVIELQGVILSAQSSALSAQSDQFALLERIRELEKEIADSKAWDTEKNRYELKDVAAGAFAYVLKPNERGREPQHWLCTTCYSRGQKNLFQAISHSGREKMYICATCKTAIRVPYTTSPGSI